MEELDLCFAIGPDTNKYLLPAVFEDDGDKAAKGSRAGEDVEGVAKDVEGVASSPAWDPVPRPPKASSLLTEDLSAPTPFALL